VLYDDDEKNRWMISCDGRCCKRRVCGRRKLRTGRQPKTMEMDDVRWAKGSVCACRVHVLHLGRVKERMVQKT
jgi:hypothetical protein